MQMTEKLCPKCQTPMELVEGEISPAHQAGSEIIDARWGKWWECPSCFYDEDLSRDIDEYSEE